MNFDYVNNTELTMEEKVKIFILETLNYANMNPQNALNYRGIAYGALQFATNNCFSEYNEDLAKWWDNEIYPLFTQLIRG